MIAIFSQCFPPRIGGIESVMSSLADVLHKHGEEVFVITDSKGDTSAEADFDQKQPYTILRCGGLKLLRNAKKKYILKKLANNKSIKSIFADSWKSNEAIAQLSKDRDIPLFCFAHGNEVLPSPDSLKKEKRIRKALTNASKIIAISKSTAELVKHYISNEEKCTVIYNLVPLPENLAYSDSDLEKIKQYKGDPTLLTLGRIEPRKGHDQVIKCLPRIKKEHPNIKYWIAGKGADQSRLKKLALDLDVSEQVVFWGSIDESVKNLLLKQATLMVMPNRHEEKSRSIEGFGLVYIEAAYHHLPVIAGKSGGAAEAVTDGVTGVLCEGNNLKDVELTILNSLRQLDKMKAYAKVGYKHAIKRHNPEYVFKHYKAMWN